MENLMVPFHGYPSQPPVFVAIETSALGNLIVAVPCIN
jgi:hypothetical protein